MAALPDGFVIDQTPQGGSTPQGGALPPGFVIDGQTQDQPAPAPQPLTPHQRLAAARRALAQGAPDQPAGGNDAGTGPAMPTPATPAQLGSEWKQAGIGAAKALPATISGAPGDIEGMGRNLINGLTGKPLVSTQTVLPTSGEGGLAHSVLGLDTAPSSDPDQQAGFQMAQILMGLKGGARAIKGPADVAAPVEPTPSNLPTNRYVLHQAVQTAKANANGDITKVGPQFTKIRDNPDLMSAANPDEQQIIRNLANSKGSAGGELSDLATLYGAETLGQAVGLPGSGYAAFGAVKGVRALRNANRMKSATGDMNTLAQSIIDNSADATRPGPTGPKVTAPPQPWQTPPTAPEDIPSATPEQTQGAADLMAARRANARVLGSQAQPLLQQLAAQVKARQAALNPQPAPAAPVVPPIDPLQLPKDITAPGQALAKGLALRQKLMEANAPTQGPTDADFFNADQANARIDAAGNRAQAQDATGLMAARRAVQKLQGDEEAPADQQPAEATPPVTTAISKKANGPVKETKAPAAEAPFPPDFSGMTRGERQALMRGISSGTMPASPAVRAWLKAKGIITDDGGSPPSTMQPLARDVIDRARGGRPMGTHPLNAPRNGLDMTTREMTYFANKQASADRFANAQMSPADKAALAQKNAIKSARAARLVAWMNEQ